MVNKVKKLRTSLMLSQVEFAEKLKVDVSTVSRWERNLQRPRLVHLRGMCRLANTTEVRAGTREA